MENVSAPSPQDVALKIFNERITSELFYVGIDDIVANVLEGANDENEHNKCVYYLKNGMSTPELKALFIKCYLSGDKHLPEERMARDAIKGALDVLSKNMERDVDFLVFAYTPGDVDEGLLGLVLNELLSILYDEFCREAREHKYDEE